MLLLFGQRYDDLPAIIHILAEVQCECNLRQDAWNTDIRCNASALLEIR